MEEAAASSSAPAPPQPPPLTTPTPTPTTATTISEATPVPEAAVAAGDVAMAQPPTEGPAQSQQMMDPQAVLELMQLLQDPSMDNVKLAIRRSSQYYRELVSWIIEQQDSSKRTDPPVEAPAPAARSEQPAVKLEEAPASHPQTAPVFSDTIEKTWLMWLQLKGLICNLLDSTNNEGVRTHCIKFIETIVLLQTPSDKYTDLHHQLNLIDPLMTPVKLSEKLTNISLEGLPANGILFDESHKLQLVEAAKQRFEQLIVFHGTSHISSVNLMAAMQALVVVAKQRHRLFMGRVIQAFESIHNRLPPTLTESQVTSVRKYLKLQLTVMLRHPYSLDRYQVRITHLLQAVGTKQPEIFKLINDFKTKLENEHHHHHHHHHQHHHNNPDSKRIKLDPNLAATTATIKGAAHQAQSALPRIGGKSKHLDLNKLTQELDEKEKRQIVVDSLRRILGDEKRAYISPAQMEIKKKVLSTLANEFHNTDCPKIIQDYIFDDLRNRHEICYAIIRKNFTVANARAAKRQLNLFDNPELLENYFDCFNSYLSRAMELKDTKDREIILPKLYALREEYYTASNQDQEQDQEQLQSQEVGVDK